MIPYDLYFFEKVWFAGNLVSAILYGAREKSTPPSVRAHFVLSVILGIVIVLFFKCIVALFNSNHRRGEPVKWGIVSYTVVMFSLATVGTTMQLDLQSISYIDNRGFPARGAFPPGPIGYQLLIESQAMSVIQNVTFTLSNWLADGFLVCSLLSRSRIQVSDA